MLLSSLVSVRDHRVLGTGYRPCGDRTDPVPIASRTGKPPGRHARSPSEDRRDAHESKTDDRLADRAAAPPGQSPMLSSTFALASISTGWRSEATSTSSPSFRTRRSRRDVGVTVTTRPTSTAPRAAASSFASCRTEPSAPGGGTVIAARCLGARPDRTGESLWESESARS
jgi:hypothetical protein